MYEYGMTYTMYMNVNMFIFTVTFAYSIVLNRIMLLASYLSSNAEIQCEVLTCLV